MESIGALEKKKHILNSELNTLRDTLKRVKILLNNTNMVEKFFSNTHFPEIELGVKMYIKHWRGLHTRIGGAHQYYGESATMWLGIIEREWTQEYDGLKMKLAIIKNIETKEELEVDPKNATFWFYFHRIKKKLGRLNVNLFDELLHDYKEETPGTVLVQDTMDVASGTGEENILIDALRDICEIDYPPKRRERARDLFTDVFNELLGDSVSLEMNIKTMEEKEERLDKLIGEAERKRLYKRRKEAIELVNTIEDLGANEEEICEKVSKILEKERLEGFKGIKAMITNKEDVKVLSNLKALLKTEIIEFNKPEEKTWEVHKEVEIKIPRTDLIKKARRAHEKICNLYNGRERSLLASHLEENVRASEGRVRSFDEQPPNKQRKILEDIKKVHQRQKTIVDILQKADEIHRRVVPERMTAEDTWIFVDLEIRKQIFLGEPAYPSIISRHANEGKWENAEKVTNILLYFLKENYKKVGVEKIPEAVKSILNERYDELEEMMT